MVSRHKQTKRRHDLLQVRSIHDLSRLLAVDANTLVLYSLKPTYNSFRIPKKNGKFREIEDPVKPLKKIQRQLSKYLSALYHPLTPDSVYGFCTRVGFEEERGILQNAEKHLNAMELWNVDIRDFFHSVSDVVVDVLLEQLIPNLEDETRTLLVKLLTYKSRLPMGAPTSPVLSNIAMLDLDHELLGVCEGLSITYTRYVDDLSFSSNCSIPESDQSLIREVVAYNGFSLNESKSCYFTKDEPKTITGLLVTSRIDLPEGYMQKLDKEIEVYRHMLIADARYQTGMSGKKTKLFKKEIMGKLEFASKIRGGLDQEINELYKTMYSMKEPNPDVLSMDWLEIPYEIS